MLEARLRQQREEPFPLARGDERKAVATKAFSDGCFAVLDLTADFYLAGLALVFGTRGRPRTGSPIAAAHRSPPPMQTGVGTTGWFGGKRWESQVYPVVRNTILASYQDQVPGG
jgi:poly-beta-hydroxyalkanoate depolymerase